MSAVFTSPEQVVNDALKRLGVKLRVGSLMDGSEPSKCALDIYAQTRDAQLRTINPDFAETTATAVASSADKPPQWSNIFEYPADCVNVRAVFPYTYLTDMNNPLPANWTVANGVDGDDQTRVILTQFPSARIVYTKRVTDPQLWDADFTEAMSAALARRLAPVLSDLNVEKVEEGDEQASDQTAAARMG